MGLRKKSISVIGQEEKREEKWRGKRIIIEIVGVVDGKWE